MIRIKDIAARAGVSTTTVSNVIHNKPGKVSPEVAQRIHSLIKEMGYVPSLTAQMLARDTSRIIGVVEGNRAEEICGSESALMSACMVGYLEEAIHRSGYYMMLFTQRTPEEIAQECQAWNFDGLIVMGDCTEVVDRLSQCISKPMVVIGHSIPEERDRVISVCADYFGSGKNLACYLMDQGIRELYYMIADENERYQRRWEGFRSALEERNIPCPDHHLIRLPSSREERYNCYRSMMQSIKEHTAYCFCSDLYAAEAMSWMTAHGAAVPDQISITGFDDLPYAQAVCPPMTSVCQEAGELADMAVATLNEMMEGKSQTKSQKTVATTIIERGSVRRGS